MDASFSIAGFVIKLRLEAGPLKTAIDEAWRPFESTETPNVTIEVSFLDASRSLRPRQRTMPRVEVLRDNSWTIEGEDFTGSVNSMHTSAQVTQPADQRFPLESVAKLLLADQLLDRGGLLVHSVGLAHQDAGALFTGPSGAGKTTLADLSREAGLTVLSDELVAVQPAGDGYSIFGTPWNVGFQKRARLTRLGLLAFARQPQLECVQAGELFRVLLANVLMADSGPEGRSRCFRAASDLIRTVRGVRLAFAQSPSVGEVLRHALES